VNIKCEITILTLGTRMCRLKLVYWIVHFVRLILEARKYIF
jgi:hypothetical protein